MAYPRVVLLTEDDGDTAGSIHDLLRAINPTLEVEWVRTAEDAIRRIEARSRSTRAPYRAMLVDYNLAGMLSGYAVWQKHQQRCPEVPFFLMSALQCEEVYGHFDGMPRKPPFLSKPFDIEACLEALKNCLED